MEILFAAVGIVGALSCVGMYAAVSLGYASTERPLFFIVNGLGAVLVMVGAWHNFDVGDLGTILQEIIWTGLSIAGGVRVWRLGQQREAQHAFSAQHPVPQAVQTAAAHKKGGERNVQLPQPEQQQRAAS